jgi:diaminopimelate decarboxylase
MLKQMTTAIQTRLVERSIRAQRQHRPPFAEWGAAVSSQGHLTLGGITAVDLIKRYGSPLMVVNADILARDADAMLNAVKVAPNGAQVFSSYKTNAIPGILKQLHAKGIGAEVISPYELWLANQLGVPGPQVIYNGVAKTDDSLDLALRMHVAAINIDALNEIDRIGAVAQRRGERANVGLRLALVTRSQFGLSMTGEHLEACRRVLARPDLFDLRCVHFNVTSNSRGSAEHTWAVAAALRFLETVQREHHVTIPLLDIGGGFGVPTTRNLSQKEYFLYRGLGVLPTPPDANTFQPIAECMADIVRVITETCTRLRLPVPMLAVEPGRFLTSRAQVLLTKINSIKPRRSGYPFVLTDAGRLSTTFPCDFEYHDVLVANRPLDPPTQPYMVMGRVCTSSDWLVRNRPFPTLTTNDILAVMDAGAYFSSYSMTFAFTRPAIVLVEDGAVSMLREAEPFEHLIAMDSPPV